MTAAVFANDRIKLHPNSICARNVLKISLLANNGHEIIFLRDLSNKIKKR